MGDKYDPVNLFLVDTDNCNDWFKNEKSNDTARKSDKEEFDLPPLEGDEEEVKGEKCLKIFTSKQIINQTFTITGTSKSWKQFIQIKK